MEIVLFLLSDFDHRKQFQIFTLTICIAHVSLYVYLVLSSIVVFFTYKVCIACHSSLRCFTVCSRSRLGLAISEHIKPTAYRHASTRANFHYAVHKRSKTCDYVWPLCDSRTAMKVCQQPRRRFLESHPKWFKGQTANVRLTLTPRFCSCI